MADLTKYVASPLAAIVPYNVVFCDDIRREMNGKEILIGVYSADILVPAVPIVVNMSLFIQVKIENIESAVKAKLRVVDVSGNRAGEIVIDNNVFNLKKHSGIISGAISLPPLPISIVQSGSIIVYWEDEGEQFQVIGEKRVIIGQAPAASPLPS